MKSFMGILEWVTDLEALISLGAMLIVAIVFGLRALAHGGAHPAARPVT